MEDYGLYKEIILDHYRHPRKAGHLKHYTASAQAANPLCGDTITVYLEVKKGKIIDCSHDSQGCALSVASASLLFDLLPGKRVSEVEKLGTKDILNLTHTQLTPSRLKCALLPLEAVKRAL